MKDKGEFFNGLTKEEQDELKESRRFKECGDQWRCKICGCKSDTRQEFCPNGCEPEESFIEIVRKFHEAVETFCSYHLQDSYDHCEVCLTKEFTKMKKEFWEVKEKILER